jgi:predicted nucleic acid-binding protein
VTIDIARLAGKLDAEQQRLGVLISFADLPIGTTARALSRLFRVDDKSAPRRAHSWTVSPST